MVRRVRQLLEQGQVAIGSFLFVPSPMLAEIVGLVGFDFVVIDMEHGPIQTETAENMVRAAEIGGAEPLVRVSSNSAHDILRALDLGAAGVHVPNVNNLDDVHEMISSGRYGPLGKRGLAGVRAAQYGLRGNLAEYCEQANREVILVAQIESREAIENIDKLLEIQGVDVFYVGPVDISNSLGIPGQVKDLRVVDAVEGAIRSIVRAGRVAGCMANKVEEAKRYLDLGARYIATHAVRLMAAECSRFLDEARR